MPTSSSMTRMRDFTLARVDTDGANRSLIRTGNVHVDGEHVAGIRRAGEAVVTVSRVDGPPIDFHDDVVALDPCVVRRAERIDARHPHAVHAAWQPQPPRCGRVDIAHAEPERHAGVTGWPHGVGFI